jgi:iron complex outermembrane receptor protein
MIRVLSLPAVVTACILSSWSSLAEAQQDIATAQPGPAQPEAHHESEEGEPEEIIVQATRSRRRVQDEPIRVEVLSREEIEEKALMRPGNIAMLMNETGGVRVQVTSPALGAANIRVQGMEGRYTQLLADGLPLYGGQASSLGVLQIPPTDLGQVEVIKGAASALYGPSALGGVINLVSRRPRDALAVETLANATTRNGQDLTAYAASPLGEGLGASLTGGFHRQRRQDLDDDGWIDMAGYDRWSVRPRLFWEGGSGASVFLTGGGMTEDRRGGTLPGATVRDGQPFVQAQKTQRYDAGIVAEVAVAGIGTAHIRAAGMTQDHKHWFGDVVEDDQHGTLFGELSFSGGSGRTPWVGGVAVQRDSYRSDTFAVFDYTYTVPGAFLQFEHDVRDDLTLAASGRVDAHSDFGTQFSPRFSMLYRPGPWRVRASVGRGFYAPTPFVEEIEEAGLSRLEPLRDLKAETAQTGSVDIGYARGAVEASVNLFASNIDNATRLEDVDADSVRLVNVDGLTKIRGSEVLLRYRWRQFTVTGSYVYVDATEPKPEGLGRRRVPLTPKHTGGLVAMWEDHDKGRIGVEAYYTGRQRLEDNPYRSISRPYLHLGVLGEVVVGEVRLFVNAENILNVRQTRYDPLLLPTRAPSGAWTTDMWAPAEGFILNGGVRLRLGGEH